MFFLSIFYPILKLTRSVNTYLYDTIRSLWGDEHTHVGKKEWGQTGRLAAFQHLWFGASYGLGVFWACFLITEILKYWNQCSQPEWFGDFPLPCLPDQRGWVEFDPHHVHHVRWPPGWGNYFLWRNRGWSMSPVKRLPAKNGVHPTYSQIRFHGFSLYMIIFPTFKGHYFQMVDFIIRQLDKCITMPINKR